MKKYRMVFLNVILAFLAAFAGGIGTSGGDAIGKAAIIGAIYAGFRALLGALIVELTKLRDLNDV